MAWLRRLIILFPLALLAFFGVAFLSVRVAPPKKLNQLTIGSIGEAKILNPILSTTTADSEINALVFQGLLKYDEDINLAPELAERWAVAQTSTLFFETDTQAGKAAQILRDRQDLWPQWNLSELKTDGSRLSLRFRAAGTSYEETLLPLLAELEPLPVSFVRIGLARGAKLADKPATSQDVLPLLESAIRQDPARGQQILSTFVLSSSQFDFVIKGDPQGFAATADAALSGRLLSREPDNIVGYLLRLLWIVRPKPPLGPMSACEVAETFPVLNEPEIVFQLRRGVRWHDGKPFTAHDVEFTYRAIMDEKTVSPRRPDYELVRSLEVLDEYALRVVYRQPYAPCLLSWMMGMLPKHILDGKDTQWWAANFNRSPVGTGPFRFDEWRSNQYIRLRRNDDYWEGKPHLDAVVVRVIPDMVSLRLLFETGEVDFWGIDPHAIKRFLDDPAYEVFAREAPAFEYVGWNLNRPMFQDVRVRRALAHAVNVPQMIEFILYGQGVQSTGPFPPQMWYCNPEVKPFEYDPGKARALLAEAGWKPGPDGVLQKDGKKFEFTLITNHPNERRKDIATLVQSDLQKVGIKVKVQMYEWAVFISQYINKQDFDACVLGWNLGYDYDQYQLWHSSQAEPGRLNHSGYRNKEVDRLLELARSEFDEEKAKKYLWELHRRIYEDQPYLFTVVPRSTGAMHRGLYAVKRPDDRGGWIEEPIRSTKVGFRVYQEWWHRPALTP